MSEEEEKMDVENVEDENEENESVEGSESDGDENSSSGSGSEEESGSSEESDSDDVVEEVTLRVSDLDDHLICFICKGYLRNAQTIVECLHTFCKSCIMKHFRNQEGPKSCPKCSVSLQGDGLSSLRFDSTMQDLVDKIFPTLKVEDEVKEDEFYRKRNIKRKSSEQRRNEPADSKTTTTTTTTTTTSSVPSTKRPKTDESEKKTPTPSGKVIQNAEVSFKILPNESVPEMLKLSALPKPFLRTPGKLKISHLQKYLATKLKGEVMKKEDIQLSCLGEDENRLHVGFDFTSCYWKDSEAI